MSGGGSLGRVAFASFIGTAIEFYDFYIYGTAAALVLGGVFFPGFSEAAGTLAAFATFAVAFFARPLGGVLFGHFGDRVGRKAMLVLSLLIMGVATFLIGLLPGFAAIGITAPALLVLLRFLQGLGLGGEWGGAVLLATEHATESRRGLYSSFPQMGPAAGFLLANGLFLVLTLLLSEEKFASWGWRVPFLFSLALVVVGLYVRISISETPVFRRALETRTRARVPFWDMLRAYPGVLVLSSGAISLTYVLFYTITTFSLAYGTSELGMSSSTLLYCTMISVAVMGVAVPVFAALSDRVGRRRLCLAGAGLAGLWAFPLFWLLDTGEPLLVALAFTVGMLAFAVIYGPMGAYLPELYGTRLRYSGAAVSYNLGGVFGGALAPTIATQLMAWAGGSWAVSAYILFMAALSFLCLLLLSETYLTDLSELREEERRVLAEEGESAPGEVL
ncbi:Inner membrane metabolite transport protein YhjE [Rubrobacter xylanophilus DSM 9941]|uniref:MFS transporter n=1 Tax=Rubrobacter xylanophilus TaxID=49319 RepID=UPI001F3FEAB1|nr:MFS transporter [Rubrobacter xylanophilus]QYJ16461.1 Inner membrane metabolite transport protein YhjE [Rubrobacter xylanophilus DSM 9941]